MFITKEAKASNCLTSKFTDKSLFCTSIKWLMQQKKQAIEDAMCKRSLE